MLDVGNPVDERVWLEAFEGNCTGAGGAIDEAAGVVVVVPDGGSLTSFGETLERVWLVDETATAAAELLFAFCSCFECIAYSARIALKPELFPSGLAGTGRAAEAFSWGVVGWR